MDPQKLHLDLCTDIKTKNYSTTRELTDHNVLLRYLNIRERILHEVSACIDKWLPKL